MSGIIWAMIYAGTGIAIGYWLNELRFGRLRRFLCRRMFAAMERIQAYERELAGLIRATKGGG